MEEKKCYRSPHLNKSFQTGIVVLSPDVNFSLSRGNILEMFIKFQEFLKRLNQIFKRNVWESSYIIRIT